MVAEVVVVVVVVQSHRLSLLLSWRLRAMLPMQGAASQGIFQSCGRTEKVATRIKGLLKCNLSPPLPLFLGFLFVIFMTAHTRTYEKAS